MTLSNVPPAFNDGWLCTTRQRPTKRAQRPSFQKPPADTDLIMNMHLNLDIDLKIKLNPTGTEKQCNLRRKGKLILSQLTQITSPMVNIGILQMAI